MIDAKTGAAARDRHTIGWNGCLEKIAPYLSNGKGAAS